MNKAIRWSLVIGAASLAGAGAVGMGCGGDDSTPATTTPDGSTGNETSTGPEAAPPTDAPPPIDAGTHAKLILLHAAPGLPPVRFCYALGTAADGSDAVIAGLAPQPDQAVGAQPFPGLYPGTGGASPDFGIDLSKKVIVTYWINAQAIASDAVTEAGAATPSCSVLLGATDAGGLDPSLYGKLAPLPAGTLKADSTILLALTGCLPGNPEGPYCGPDFGDAGNVGVKVFNLDRAVTASSTQVGAQVIHVSSEADYAVKGAGVDHLGVFLAGPVDAAADAAPVVESITTSVKYGAIDPVPAIAVGLTNPNETVLFDYVPNPDGGAPLLTEPLGTLGTVYQLTTGAPTPTGAAAYFADGANYTFVLMGNPGAPAFLDSGAFNGYTFHALAFPNNPTLPK